MYDVSNNLNIFFFIYDSISANLSLRMSLAFACISNGAPKCLHVTEEEANKCTSKSIENLSFKKACEDYLGKILNLNIAQYRMLFQSLQLPTTALETAVSELATTNVVLGIQYGSLP